MSRNFCSQQVYTVLPQMDMKRFGNYSMYIDISKDESPRSLLRVVTFFKLLGSDCNDYANYINVIRLLLKYVVKVYS